MSRHQIAIFLLCAIIAFSSAISALKVVEKPSGYDIETDALAVSITGGSNVPKFEISRAGNDSSTTKYKVQFNAMYQTTGIDTIDRIPSTQISLPSLSWTFANFQQYADSLSFTLRSEGNTFGALRFLVRVNSSSLAFKFDTEIADTPDSFWANNAGALVLSYKVLEQGGGGSDKDSEVAVASTSTTDETEVRISNKAFMRVDGRTTTTSGEKKTKTSVGNGGMIYILYEKFNTSMIHDPTIGISTGVSNTLAFGAVIISLMGMFLWM